MEGFSMGAAKIKSLKPNVSREDAVRAFSSRGFAGRLRLMRGGPFRFIADAYVPFRFYKVSYRTGGMERTRYFAIDAMDGSLDLLEFPQAPAPQELFALETRNFLPVCLPAERAKELLRERVLRIIFQHGFFRLCKLDLIILSPPLELYLPYWLGFHEARGAVRCWVMDAVRRRIEGAKASALFEQWLAA